MKMEGKESHLLDQNEQYSDVNTPHRKRYFNYYGSPYKKVPGSQSCIGLPDWSHRNYSTKTSLVSNSWNGQQKNPISRKKSLRFMEPDYLFFLEDQMESNQLGEEEYFFRQNSYFSAENSYLGHENPHIPEIEPMFESGRKGVPSEYKSLELPDIYDNVNHNTSDNESQEDSEIIPENKFTSLKQIDKVFNREYKPVILPPIVPKHVNKKDIFIHETNSETSDDKKKASIKKKQRNGKEKNGNLNGKTKSKNHVHFLKVDEEKNMKKVKPILPKIVGLHLTYRDILDREIPAIVTKYLCPLGNKTMTMSMEQLVSIFESC